MIANSDWFYDAAIKGADAISDRPGFASMLRRLLSNGVRTVIVESPDRFARDLIVQLTGHDHLKAHGIALIPASAPDYFLEDTPTAVLVRQVLRAIAEFEKANLVAKLKGARDRKRASGLGRAQGRKTWAEKDPAGAEVKRLRGSGLRPDLSLREIAAKLAGHGRANKNGEPFTSSSIKQMLA